MQAGFKDFWKKLTKKKYAAAKNSLKGWNLSVILEKGEKKNEYDQCFLEKTIGIPNLPSRDRSFYAGRSLGYVRQVEPSFVFASVISKIYLYLIYH